MRGVVYQLKSVCKDKFCILSFFLPIIVAFALRFMGTLDLSSVAEFHFGIVEGEAPALTISWLERYGSVTAYKTQEELTTAIKEPSTNLIGVKADDKGIKTMISGDEIDLFCQAADTLPALYAGREYAKRIPVTVLERPDLMAGLGNVFFAMTLIAAMFMGCTFNAVNMISEKEEGVDMVVRILPMTQGGYAVQKIFVGFAGGCLSAMFTACICFRLPYKSMVLMLTLIIFSAFAAALTGLFIGKFSEGIMAGVVYIKILMIVYMAVPLLSYLLGADGLIAILCYFVPSTAAFEGIMDLANDADAVIVKETVILAAHCVIWFLLYLLVSRPRGKRRKDGLNLNDKRKGCKVR